jgi:hypothetical protein
VCRSLFLNISTVYWHIFSWHFETRIFQLIFNAPIPKPSPEFFGIFQFVSRPLQIRRGGFSAVSRKYEDFIEKCGCLPTRRYGCSRIASKEH